MRTWRRVTLIAETCTFSLTLISEHHKPVIDISQPHHGINDGICPLVSLVGRLRSSWSVLFIHYVPFSGFPSSCGYFSRSFPGLSVCGFVMNRNESCGINFCGMESETLQWIYAQFARIREPGPALSWYGWDKRDTTAQLDQWLPHYTHSVSARYQLHSHNGAFYLVIPLLLGPWYLDLLLKFSPLSRPLTCPIINRARLD